MSLAIATYIPEGIVMASDSRQYINIEGKSPDGQDFKIETINSDSVMKTFLLEKHSVGISNFGVDLLGGIPMASHIKTFIEEEVKENDEVTDIAEKLLKYFTTGFPNSDTGFLIAGYKKERKISLPHVYFIHVGRNELIRRNVKKDAPEAIDYGAAWAGQIDVLSGIIRPHLAPGPDGKEIAIQKAPIMWQAMSLQDAIDFSVYAIRTTIDTIRFQARPKNVGGPIDVLVITPELAKWIQHKELKGE